MNPDPVQPQLEGTLETWPEAPEGGWKRVLLKLSGEAFAGGGGLGVDPDTVQTIARQDRKSTRLNSSHSQQSRMPSSA